MNIGEISKPSADRTLVDKKLKVDQTEAVLKTQVVSDLVKLSEESQKRYQQEHKNEEETPSKDKIELEPETETQKKSSAIDLRV